MYVPCSIDCLIPGGGEATNFEEDDDSSEEDDDSSEGVDASSEEDDVSATSREKFHRVPMFQTESTKTGAKDKNSPTHAYEEIHDLNPPIPPPRSSSISEVHTQSTTITNSSQELQSMCTSNCRPHNVQIKLICSF